MREDAGVLIRRARRAAGLAQAELARRAGVTQPVISAYENGAREPSVATLRRLIEATGHDLVVDLAPRPSLPDGPLAREIAQHRAEILAAVTRRRARNPRVFGSVARGDAGPRSDVDLLVDLEPGVGLIALAALEAELSDLLGTHVDVVPASLLKARVGERALAEAVPL